MKLTDLGGLSQLVKLHNEKYNNANNNATAGYNKNGGANIDNRQCIHVCDSTFATPLITRPLEYGVDVVVQSITKFYDGQNTCTGGAAIAGTKEYDDKIKFYLNMHGNIISPQNAFYILQSTKTMPLRIRQQSQTVPLDF